jgi:hypothetical protein
VRGGHEGGKIIPMQLESEEEEECKKQ